MVALALAVGPLSQLLEVQFAYPALARHIVMIFVTFVALAVVVCLLDEHWVVPTASLSGGIAGAVLVDRFASVSVPWLPPVLASVSVVVIIAEGMMLPSRALRARRLALMWISATWMCTFAATAGWLAVRNFGVLGLGLTASACAALGFLPVVRRPSPGHGASVLLLPLLATDGVLATRSGVRLPTAMVGGLLVLLACAALLPTAWARVEAVGGRATRIVDLGLDRCDHLLQRMVWVLRRRVGTLLRQLIGPLRRLDRRVRQAFEILAAGLRAVLFAAFWVAVVLTPWAFHRALGWDPLWSPRQRSSRWVPRIDEDSRPSAQWESDSVPPTLRRQQARRRRRRLRSALRPAGVVLAVALVIVVRIPEVEPQGPGQTGQSWYPVLLRAQSDAFDGEALSQFVGIELPDATSRYLNIKAGQRASWEPPSSSCGERLVVWFFGGSTGFGLNQRDDRTIPSEVARLAWSEGQALEIANWAVPGDVAFQEQRRLERLFDTVPDAPDLVVFYDGFNDLRAQAMADRIGRGGEGTFMAFLDSDLLPALEEAQLLQRGGARSLRLEVADPAGLPEPNFSDVVPAALFQYNAAHRSTAELLARHDVPGTRFFQPVLASRAHRVPGDFRSAPQDVAHYAKMREGLAAGVVDVAGALDASRKAVYTDDVHTTEAANPLIAAAMYDHLEPVLDGLTPHAGRSAACS